ncbi:LysR family transcriptional regulator [Humitalea rosea]|uniref:LysR family transcriptional regulator n=1 Tax=Humitalea rosea TaxID=990373 RepID=A0A2W7IKZ9_9PROT|nr:LysR substrate-binding domain-containing protein [Humitalea rosea]PZW46627.1 LysR family transcriptional regulator [Humitalea rosea]
MTLQQLACFCSVVDAGLRVSRAAELLQTTQPAVSKMIRAVETAVGSELFQRRGNRLVGLTDTGREALSLARRAVSAAADLSTLAGRRGGSASGTLRVATTHIHARYALLPVVQRFARLYPGVSLTIAQGTPAQIVAWVEQGAAELGLSTLLGPLPPATVALRSYDIERCLIVPPGHALLRARPLTLEAIARHSLIAYDEGFSSGQAVLSAFRRQGLMPRIVLRATEAAIIKAYVGAGVGVAVIQRLAVDSARDTDLRVIDSGDLFPVSTAFLTLRRDSFLPGYVTDFIAMVAPRWTPARLQAALATGRGIRRGGTASKDPEPRLPQD